MEDRPMKKDGSGRWNVEALESRLLLCDPVAPFDDGMALVAPGWATGTKKVLYIRATYAGARDVEPITEAVAYGVMQEVDAFFSNSSFQQLDIVPTVTNVLVPLPQTQEYYANFGPLRVGEVRRDALAAAKALNSAWAEENFQFEVVRAGIHSSGGEAFVEARGA